jgi:hypothetical protein
MHERLVVVKWTTPYDTLVCNHEKSSCFKRRKTKC